MFYFRSIYFIINVVTFHPSCRGHCRHCFYTTVHYVERSIWRKVLNSGECSVLNIRPRNPCRIACLSPPTCGLFVFHSAFVPSSACNYNFVTCLWNNRVLFFLSSRSHAEYRRSLIAEFQFPYVPDCSLIRSQFPGYYSFHPLLYRNSSVNSRFSDNLYCGWQTIARHNYASNAGNNHNPDKNTSRKNVNDTGNMNSMDIKDSTTNPNKTDNSNNPIPSMKTRSGNSN